MRIFRDTKNKTVREDATPWPSGFLLFTRELAAYNSQMIYLAYSPLIRRPCIAWNARRTAGVPSSSGDPADGMNPWSALHKDAVWGPMRKDRLGLLTCMSVVIIGRGWKLGGTRLGIQKSPLEHTSYERYTCTRLWPSRDGELRFLRNQCNAPERL